MTENLIEITELTKIYGMGNGSAEQSIAVHALRGVDFRVKPGEFVAIMGAIRLGQEHADEHPGLPGPAHGR